jgi:hypothetical protein
MAETAIGIALAVTVDPLGRTETAALVGLQLEYPGAR